MLISVINQKGGVGKTTLAVHLTAFLADRGFNVAAIDADTQASATKWLRKACPGVECLTAVSPDQIAGAIEVLEPHVDVIIADTPPTLNDNAQMALWHSDVALFPTEIGGLDLYALAQACDLARKMEESRPKGPIQMTVVLNRVIQNTILTREGRGWTKGLHVPVASAEIAQRVAFKIAATEDTVVERMGPAAQAAAYEIENVFREVLPNVISDRFKQAA